MCGAKPSPNFRISCLLPPSSREHGVAAFCSFGAWLDRHGRFDRASRAWLSGALIITPATMRSSCDQPNMPVFSWWAYLEGLQATKRALDEQEGDLFIYLRPRTDWSSSTIQFCHVPPLPSLGSLPCGDRDCGVRA